MRWSPAPATWPNSPTTSAPSPKPSRAFGRLDIFVGNAGVFDVYAPLAEFAEEKLSAGL